MVVYCQYFTHFGWPWLDAKNCAFPQRGRKRQGHVSDISPSFGPLVRAIIITILTQPTVVILLSIQISSRYDD